VSVDPVGAILQHHGIRDRWTPLPATGVANRIYATRDVVLRIATDHPEAVEDARTESVAAPVARRAGLPVPELIAFDDSRVLVDRPYSIWERVHGETLGLFRPDPASVPETWRDVGRRLAHLHAHVDACPDPHGWLDAPGHLPFDELRQLAEETAPHLGAHAREVIGWVQGFGAAMALPRARCFLHNDVHDMNLMCRADGSLLAIIDWGDAGWGDPALDFGEMPLAAIPFVLEGYRGVAPALLGDAPEARILAQQLWCGLEDRRDRGRMSRDVSDLRAFVARYRHAW
jgi:aminoglycoside phosphotransferase (APT) family kinase protein